MAVIFLVVGGIVLGGALFAFGFVAGAPFVLVIGIALMVGAMIFGLQTSGAQSTAPTSTAQPHAPADSDDEEPPAPDISPQGR